MNPNPIVLFTLALAVAWASAAVAPRASQAAPSTAEASSGAATLSEPAPRPPQGFAPTGPIEDGMVHYYEMWIPRAELLEDLYERGFGFERSHSPQAEEQPGSVWLTMLPPDRARELAAEGVPLRLARREAFPPGEKPEVLAAKLQGYGWVFELGGPTCVPPDGEFCQYDGAGHCTTSITAELDAFDALYPPIGVLGEYVDVVKTFAATHENRPMYAVHIGDVNGLNDPPRRRLVVVAAQHAKEWVTVEMAMRLIRRFANEYRDNVGDTRVFLTGQVITFIPVANPDGYQYTHTTNRNWRLNRFDCPGSGRYGTDVNRNAGFAWGQPGSEAACGGGEYRGIDAESEPETVRLHELIADLVSWDGRYRTAALVNWHSWGNFALYTDGINPAFVPCTTNSNGTPPDFALFREISQTELTANWRLVDEATGDPYLVDTTYRAIYEVSGSLDQEVQYGTLPGAHANFPSIALELTAGAEGFDAECIPAAELDTLEDQQHHFLSYNLLSHLDDIDDGSWAAANANLGDYATPYVQRRRPAVVLGAPERQVCVRLAARETIPAVTLTPPPGYNGGTANEGLKQLWYHQWRWANLDDPWEVPGELQVCSSAGCEWIDVDDVTGGTDLTTDVIFPNKNGWSWVGNVAGSTDYYYRFTGAGAGPWVMTRRKRNLSSVHESKLCYSYRWDRNEAKHVEVRVSRDDFASWRTVREYPRDHGYELRSSKGGGDYFTEIIDVRDFDHEPDVKVRFIVDLADATGVNTPAFDVFDCFIVAWKD